MRRLILAAAAVGLLAGAAFLTRRDPPPRPRPPARPVSLPQFREDLKRDPTLAGAILGLTREDVMATSSLTPAEKEAFWLQVQEMQAEARAHGTAPAVSVEDAED